MHVPEQDVPAILNDLRQTTKKALAALIQGQNKFDNDGTVMSWFSLKRSFPVAV